MYSLAPTHAETRLTSVYKKPKPRPVVLETSVALKAGDVVRTEHLAKGHAQCLADNPITGPFSDANDVVGRVVAIDVPCGTVLTGTYLVALCPTQMETRLRNFWRRCR